MDRPDNEYTGLPSLRRAGRANDMEISQISRALARIDDPAIIHAIGQLSERLAALVEQARCDGRRIHYSPPFSELLVDEPHGVPFCR
jgi:hypothetical protein